ncbi:MAG TPA: YihY/virulence factor BrkB family protein [Candidatus Binatia bacterium]|nr:YihY/virulence factor BrkB family protein [Candidatus Binatia bacterium]
MKVKEIKGFLEEGLWQADVESLSRIRRHLYHQLRIFNLVVKGFIDNRCLLLASALTYTSLLSLVPLLALMFSILKGLGVQNRLEPMLLEKMSAGSEEVVAQIIGYIDRTNVTTLGALGLAGLIGTAISVIGNIELSLNRIWGVQRTRSLGRKFSDYLSVLLTFPILIVAALGLTSSIQSTTLVRAIAQIPGMSYVLLLLALLGPFFLIWIALTFLYSYLPNTNVPLRSALFGGVIAGTLWQLTQWAYVHFQVGMARYNAIYGAFAQLPIFLVWLYTSWTVVLLGAVIAFAHQNSKTYRKEVAAKTVHYAFREELGLKVLLLIGKNFYSDGAAWTAEALSEKLDVPIRLVNEVLAHYCNMGILMPASQEREEVYLFAKAPEKLRLNDVIEAMRSYGGNEMRMNKIEGEETLKKTLDKVAEARRSVLSNLTLKDILVKDLP